MNIIALNQSEIDSGGRAVVRDERARHIQRVLKREVGESIQVGVIDGPRGFAVVQSISSGAVELVCELAGAPPIRPAVSLIILNAMLPAVPRFVADPNSRDSPQVALSQCIGNATNNIGRKRVAVAVGPEGGWTEHELSVLKAAKFEPFNLGSRILHSDTAALTTVALMQAFLAKGGEC